MKTFSLRIALCIAASFSLYAYADGCEYDTQCKGERICENKQCVYPRPTNPIPASVAPAEKPEQRNRGIYGVLNTAPAKPAEEIYFCCTPSDKLGPYPNPGSDGKFLQIGDACSGTSKSARMLTGRVCK